MKKQKPDPPKRNPKKYHGKLIYELTNEKIEGLIKMAEAKAKLLDVSPN